MASIKANYDIITPENCMKPQPIHPGEDRYSWGTADALVQWCEDHDIQVDAISRVTFWGISDRRSWRAQQSPLLLDRELQPKPAYQAVLDAGAARTTQP